MNLIWVSLWLSSVFASAPDWNEGATFELERSNPYELNVFDFKENRDLGKLHALQYPVSVTASLVPLATMERSFSKKNKDPFLNLVQLLLGVVWKIDTLDDFLDWMGLHSYPEVPDSREKYQIPIKSLEQTKYRMGFSIIQRYEEKGVTFSCAACHSSNLFGKKILGLSNRFPRSNELFKKGAFLAERIPTEVYKHLTHSNAAQTHLYRDLRNAMKSVDSIVPTQLGLDTALAQVALSLSRREADDYATQTKTASRTPRFEPLKKFIADSKPAVWWNLKYKNRWLSDGSVVSGNPIFTNILWNEIGRGTDLKKLEGWLNQNSKTIQELTTAVFSTEAPRYEEFFPEYPVDIAKARRGETLYNQKCSKCHGEYEKAWTKSEFSLRTSSWVQEIQTLSVNYPHPTPVKEVGTDPNRYLGMQSLEKSLNPLFISRSNGILIRSQKGYVPPPLVGIWARFPYFHNNSIPNLCVLLQPQDQRPKTYFAGPALNRFTDYDRECGGYPLDEKTPAHWKNNEEYFYDTSREGLSNEGHDGKMLHNEDGSAFSKVQILELIEFLKTL